MKNLLIVRLGAVGDGLMLAPSLADLRRVHPAAHIEVAGAVWRLRLLCGPTLANVVTPFEEFFAEGRVISDRLQKFDRIVLFAIRPETPLVREIATAFPDRVEVHYS